MFKDLKEATLLLLLIFWLAVLTRFDRIITLPLITINFLEFFLSLSGFCLQNILNLKFSFTQTRPVDYFSWILLLIAVKRFIAKTHVVLCFVHLSKHLSQLSVYNVCCICVWVYNGFSHSKYYENVRVCVRMRKYGCVVIVYKLYIV